MFHDRSLLGRGFRVFSCQFFSTVLQSGARLPIHTLDYWTVQSLVPGFSLGLCFSVRLLIVDPWQSCVCFIRSGVTRCTLLMVLYLDHMCQCGCIFVSPLVAHRYTYAPSRCRTSQYSRTFIPLSVSLFNGLTNTEFDGVGLAGFKSRANISLLAQAALSLL